MRSLSLFFKFVTVKGGSIDVTFEALSEIIDNFDIENLKCKYLKTGHESRKVASPETHLDEVDEVVGICECHLVAMGTVSKLAKDLKQLLNHCFDHFDSLKIKFLN